MVKLIAAKRNKLIATLVAVITLFQKISRPHFLKKNREL